MITRVARIMAAVAFASTRCCSFIHSASRFVRIGAQAGKYSALHSSPHLEKGTTHETQSVQRGNADSISLDTMLIYKNPQLVLGHLKARRQGEDTFEAVHRVAGTVASAKRF